VVKRESLFGSGIKPGPLSQWFLRFSATLHLMHEKEIAGLLGIPDTMTQTALLPVAYFTSDDFRPASRVPSRERTYWNLWGKVRDV